MASTEIIYTDGPDKINGFPVLVYLGTDVADGLVICDRGATVHDRFVTWRVSRVGRVDNDTPATWSAYWGHYTSDLRDALANMDERSQ